MITGSLTQHGLPSRRDNAITTAAGIAFVLGETFFGEFDRLPKSYIGSDVPAQIRKALLLGHGIFLSVAAVGMTVLMIMLSKNFFGIWSLHRQVRGLADSLWEEKNNRRSGIFAFIGGTFFALCGAAFMVICLFRSDGVVPGLRAAWALSRDMSSETVTETFEGGAHASWSMKDTDLILPDNGYCSALICWDSDGGTHYFPLSSQDVNDLNSQLYQYQDGRLTLTVEYFPHSRVISSLAIDGSKEPEYITSQEEADRSLEKVEVTMEILPGEKPWEKEQRVVYRPEDMSSYGDIAWVVERDGLVQQLAPGQEYSDYTITAYYYDHTDIGRFSREPGHYRVYLVKVIARQNSEGLYKDISVYCISNIIEFDI